jgi:hypothetical protein
MGFCIWEWNVQHHLLKSIDPLLLLLLLQPSLLRVGNVVVQTSIFKALGLSSSYECSFCWVLPFWNFEL